jgi:hypothetical protein
MIFTTAAYDDVVSISDVAFENVEQGISPQATSLRVWGYVEILWTVILELHWLVARLIHRLSHSIILRT